MPRLMEVGGGMPVRAQVATARAPTGKALAEMDPGVAGLDARGADRDRRIDPEVGLEVLAVRRQVAVRPMCSRAGGSACGPFTRTLAPNERALADAGDRA